MNNTGPFNFPRITNLGPFTEEKADQEFQRDIEEDKRIGGVYLDREIGAIHGIDINSLTWVNAKLVVREDIEESDGTFLDNLRKELDQMTRDNSVANMRYWYDKDTNVCRIIDVEVDKPFRNMGIATTLKRQELEYIEQHGVDLIYTDIISEGGYRLAKKTGFKPIYEADHLYDVETDLHFGSNRGIMFKYL